MPLKHFKKIICLIAVAILLLANTSCQRDEPESVLKPTEQLATSSNPETQEDQELQLSPQERIAKINAALLEQQAVMLPREPKPGSALYAFKQRVKELIAERDRVRTARRDLKDQRQSLGAIYPPNSISWRGIVLSFVSCPTELHYESLDVSTTDKAILGQSLIDQGYIVEELTAFNALDDESSHYIGHNRNPGFLPFKDMQIGDLIYITGADGQTYEYIVIDNVEGKHAGPEFYTEDGLIPGVLEEEKLGRHKKLTGKRSLSRYDSCGVEAVGLTWCRDDYVIEGFFAIPLTDYKILQEKGILD
ncbi:MAG: hypothetical protein Q4P65_04440 [Eubacteriales bacterium]|nr:hypothetical protein [Eubacteriales bacterium]